jgi:hypothetical protein
MTVLVGGGLQEADGRQVLRVRRGGEVLERLVVRDVVLARPAWTRWPGCSTTRVFTGTRVGVRRRARSSACAVGGGSCGFASMAWSRSSRMFIPSMRRRSPSSESWAWPPAPPGGTARCAGRLRRQGAVPGLAGTARLGDLRCPHEEGQQSGGRAGRYFLSARIPSASVRFRELCAILPWAPVEATARALTCPLRSARRLLPAASFTFTVPAAPARRL